MNIQRKMMLIDRYWITYYFSQRTICIIHKNIHHLINIHNFTLIFLNSFFIFTIHLSIYHSIIQSSIHPLFLFFLFLSFLQSINHSIIQSFIPDRSGVATADVMWWRRWWAAHPHPTPHGVWCDDVMMVMMIVTMMLIVWWWYNDSDIDGMMTGWWWDDDGMMEWVDSDVLLCLVCFRDECWINAFFFSFLFLRKCFFLSFFHSLLCVS